MLASSQQTIAVPRVFMGLYSAGALLVFPVDVACGQQAPRTSPEWAMEQDTRERWMHGAQQPRFTRFSEDRSFLAIDSIRREGTVRKLDVTIRRTVYGRDSALITSDASGRVLRLDAGFAPVTRGGPLRSLDSAFSERHRRVTLDGRMALAAARVWDVVVAFPPTPRIGARWTDTVRQSATDASYSQAVSGRRTSRIVRDTSVDGRRLWIVRDSAVVTYAERRPERESTLGADAWVERTVSGVVRGVYLYDPVSQLTRRRVDTAALSGEALLRYPDGRVFRTPARYERFRTWQLHDSLQYQARRDALNKAWADRSGGMVRVPQSDFARRLVRNDSMLRDSLMSALQRTRDAEEIDRLIGLVELWGRPDDGFRRRVDSIRIALGDSAHLYHALQERAYSRGPFTADDARQMIPWLENPGRAWAVNASRDYLYSNLVQGMTIWPLAAAGSGGRTACAPDACRLLGAMYSTAREPRLRDVALVALFTTDPATWADTVLRLGGAAHPLLRGSVALAGGVGANWPAARKLSMPEVNSDWRRWLLWMDGRDTGRLREQVANATRYGWRVDTAPRARFEDTHRTALRMHMAQTGRDVVSELRRGYDQATNDTAHLVFGTLLHGLGALQLSEAQMVDAFASGLPGRTGVARRALLRAFAHATPTPDSVAVPLVDRLLGIILDTMPIWRPTLPDSANRRRASPELHARRGRVRVNADNLPPAIREKWGSRVEFVPTGGQFGGDLREHAVTYTIRPVVSFGPFVRLIIDASEQMARRPDQAPTLYASGTIYYLMKLGEEWVLVAWEGWVT
jgi:hypothetical protein